MINNNYYQYQNNLNSFKSLINDNNNIQSSTYSPSSKPFYLCDQVKCVLYNSINNINYNKYKSNNQNINNIPNNKYSIIQNNNIDKSNINLYKDLMIDTNKRYINFNDNNFYNTENMIYIIIFIILIFIMFSIMCCRFRVGVKIFRGTAMILSWIFWAFFSYLLGALIFILSFIRKMIDWIWQTTLVGSTLEGYEFWYWGNDKRKIIEVDGISYIQQ